MPAENDFAVAGEQDRPTPASLCGFAESAATRSWHSVGIQRVALLGPVQDERAGTRPSRLICKHSLIDFDLHAQQRRAQSLALRIDAQRHRAAAAQRFMQQEIQGAQVGQLEARHTSPLTISPKNAFTRSAVTSRTRIG